MDRTSLFLSKGDRQAMNKTQQHALFTQRFERYTKEYAKLKDATYATLKDAILLNMVTDEITESEIAGILNISRTPIREAMLQLENDGLLEISHGKKAKIRSLTTKDIDDIALILDNLHHLSLILCIDNATPEDISAMEETVALIQFYTNRKDFHQLHKYNSRFHIQIARASRNLWLVDIMERLLSYTTVFREYAISRPNRMELACAEHTALFEAIRSRDKEEGTRLIHAHVQNAFNHNLSVPTT